ncbi:uncharacterized protein ARMOST_18438 [Armillaria ostoyae]|uniref:Uncharacterized protein n=1 Tax=Armillaria ostoyae TaxID=47428 RepID=A0A284S1R6_ARMOS|nr:uncharacterized protein ARMOST_18438 [Armillaria ostoyae]
MMKVLGTGRRVPLDRRIFSEVLPVRKSFRETCTDLLILCYCKFGRCVVLSSNASVAILRPIIAEIYVPGPPFSLGSIGTTSVVTIAR